MLDLLDHLFLRPLLVIYEAVYTWAFALGDSHGLALFVFSMLLNLTLLPIYYQMERAGRAAQLSRAQMDEEVKRLKKHYQGRERFYYLRTLHRQYGYNPLKVVLGSTDLFLQVLVFATVFRFLSTYEPLSGASFWILADLSKPDGLFFGLNVLPVVMTVVNLGAVFLYGKDRRKRLTSLALAAVFLVLLYPSPAGLVLYWTWNNLFSLGRNFIEHRIVPHLQPGLVRSFPHLADRA